MHYTEQLRRLALNDDRLNDDVLTVTNLDARAVALTRIAALVAVGGAEPSFAAEADRAIGLGVSPAEIVDVVVAVIPVVGLPRAVAAAPRVALALGADLDDAT